MEGFADQDLLVRLAIISIVFAMYGVIAFFVALAGYFILGRALASAVQRGIVEEGTTRYMMNQREGAVIVDVCTFFWPVSVPVYICYLIWERSIAVVSRLITLWAKVLNAPLKLAEDQGYRSIRKSND